MPTSSQFLIQQINDGQLPPIFGRRRRPPPVHSWSFNDYPVATVQLKADERERDASRSRRAIKPLPLAKSVRLPHLTYKLDFSTLPQLLNIRGIHASLDFHNEANSLHWKVNSIGPFYDRIQRAFSNSITPKEGTYEHSEDMKYKPHTDQQGRSKTLKFRYYHADQDHSFSEENLSNDEEETDVHENGDFNQNVKISFPDTFIRTSIKGGRTTFLQTSGETADYFKLVPIQYVSNLEGGEIFTEMIYKLEKCSSDKTCSFRLVPTTSGEVGKFRLDLHPGHTAGEFRLLQSPYGQDMFVLLQSDQVYPGRFMPVQHNKNSTEEFKFVQERLSERAPGHQTRGQQLPLNAWAETSTTENCFDWENTDLQHIKSNHTKDVFGKINDSEHNYDHRKDTNVNVEPSVYSNLRSRNQHNLRYTGESYESLVDKYLLEKTVKGSKESVNKDQNIFNSKTSHNPNTADELQTESRPVGLDKMPDVERRHYTGKSVMKVSSEWRTHDFEQWSRTTRVTDNLSEPSNVVSLGPTENWLSRTSEIKPKERIDLSFLADRENMEKFRLWKKKKMKVTRMRKELPAKDPKAVFIRFMDNAISHEELKRKIEIAADCRLESLQFDPVYVHSPDSDVSSRWVLRFEDPQVCQKLIENGLTIYGVTYNVRSYDEVMQEEHDMFKFHQFMKAMNDQKRKAENLKKNSRKPPHTVKSMQTQTMKT